MNTEKNRGDNNFATPSWEGVTKLLSAGLMPFGRNLLKPKIKRNTQQNENPRFRIDTFDCFYNPFFCFFVFQCPISIKRDKPRKMALTLGFRIEKEAGIWVVSFLSSKFRPLFILYLLIFIKRWPLTGAAEPLPPQSASRPRLPPDGISSPCRTPRSR